MIYDDTKSCLSANCLPYLFKPAAKNGPYSALRVLGFVRGERVYADIAVGKSRFYADVVTGALFSPVTGLRSGSARRIDVGACKACTLADAKSWVSGGTRREKSNGLKVWAAQGLPGVLA